MKKPAGWDPAGLREARMGPGNSADPACQIKQDQEHAPGFPYDLALFRNQVLPMVVSTCGTANCHASPAGNGGYIVWQDAAPGNCSYAKTFNSLIAKTDLGNPTNSSVYFAITGGDPAHPVILGATDPKAALLLSWVTTAQQTLNQ